MAPRPRRNTFNPLILGAIAVVAALVAFLIFREGTDTMQQAGIASPPAATNPVRAPSASPANPAPTTPDTAATKQQPSAQ